MPIVGAAKPQSVLSDKVSRPESGTSRSAWSLLGVLGGAFVVMGVADIALGIYPTAIGDPEWEFGIISSILNAFAIPTMGGYLLLSSLLASNKVVLTRVIAVLAIVVALFLIALAILYVTVIPLALKSVGQNATLLLGMQKAILKAGFLLVAYIALFIYGGMRGLAK
jgi:hypothetical protein